MHSFIFKNSNGHTEHMTHDHYFSLDSTAKNNKLRPIRKLYHEGQLELFCSCMILRPIMIPIHNSVHDFFYIKSKDKDQHSITCHYKREEGVYIPSNSGYEKGFVKRNDGKIEIKFDTQDFQLEKGLKQKKPKSNPDGTPLPSSNANGTSTYKPSVFAAMKRMITEAWNDIIQFSYYKKSPYPKNDVTTLFERLTTHTTRGYTNKTFTIQELLYKGEKEGKVALIAKNTGQKSAAFTMLLLADDGIQKNDETYRLSLRSPKSDTFRQLDVPAHLFQKAYTAIRQMPGPYIAGGFVESPGYDKTPRFLSFALVPINDYGAPIESSYERQLYNQLCDSQRAVIRPLTSENPDWAGYVPDGILVDTKPSTIIEVFGMSESMESYHQNREFKIKHFSSLKPKFDFWYWDAFATTEFNENTSKETR
ncbi:hypothetical protein [Sporosarcina sp. FSL K6-1508]|uniref:hypothetical protein n=1 Tax=Sporosarcina sp. FSL K6-1508 TaxID=2921553 RepID=UPI0030F93D72